VFGLGLLGLAALSCSTVSTKADFDRSANFSGFHTFKLLQGKALPSESGAPPNTMVGDRIREEIKTQLMGKGLTPVDENPDVLVGWVAGARTHQELESMGPYDPVMGPYMGPGYWGGGGDVWSVEYKRGTLVIDIVDAATHKMVWRSITQADKNQVSDLGTPEAVHEAVTKAFKDYPPKP
jgi:hypothetical protein